MKNEIFNNIAKIFNNLPKKIINNKNHDYLTDCILYELSQEFCLHFNEVAYFIYNPDFHLCKGIAGIKKNEVKTFCNDPWENINDFETTIKETIYNKKIKNMQFCTLFSEKNIEKIIQEIQKSIEIKSSDYYSWNLPNNNFGILLFENAFIENKFNYKEYIENAGNILAFCPIN